ncbi:MAG: amino acid ABC transporter permease [Bdellovibrionales bacterium]|nr:amino acid ABC transporter permease [Ramlibacter sp.]
MNEPVYPSESFTPLAARPAPRRAGGAWHWVQTNLLSDWLNSVITVVMLALLGWAAWYLFVWGVLNAVVAPDADACQAARGTGACWGVVTEKHRLILFGRYPYEQQWRPLVATLMLTGLVLVSCVRAFWRKGLALAWVLGFAAFIALMRGGFAGLPKVGTDQWGGLPLTMLLVTSSLALSFPLAVLVALGRRSPMPAIRTVCITFVELVRGVPLISVLFMASFMFPLLLPAGSNPDVLVRVIAGITLFSAAYVAEVIRGGLQSIPAGQLEAAGTLGLGYWKTQRLIVLPQALATVLPGLMNSLIATFKDTSLVTIVSLYELTGALGLALNGDPNWRPFKIEGYLFIMLIYFIFCFSMSRYSLWVEARLNRSKAH